jgi:hypothetical protein
MVSCAALLVQPHPEVFVEQRSEPERGEPEQLGRDAGVENVARVPAVVLVQKTQVVIGVVQHLLDARILEEGTEPLGASHGERIDDGGGVAGGQLKQVNAIDEPMEARAFGIEGDFANASHCL